LDGLSLASLTIAPDSVLGICDHLGLSCRYLDQPPMGGASAIAAVRRAARMVMAGDVDHVAVIGADRNDGTSFVDLVANFSRVSREAVWPYGAGGPNAVFALLTHHYMRAYGATKADFGTLCLAQREMAQSVPHAIFHGVPLTREDYDAARLIADPLCLYDCVMPVSGAEGLLVMKEADAIAKGLPFARILSTLERHNAFRTDPVQVRGGWAVEADAFWARAGMSPDGVDVVETYDDYPVMAMIQWEDLGLCGKGEAPAFLRARDPFPGGDFAHNTSGGQLSAGQAGAAGGHLGLVEGLRQVTGQAFAHTREAGQVHRHDWQVKDAEVALVSGFGMVNYDRGMAATACLLATGRRAAP
ncbi:MAG: thiolase family protein, partial [Pseudomonadota bacterium]